MISQFNLSSVSSRERARIMLRAQQDIDGVRPTVEQIIADVRQQGDTALLRYTREWDDPSYDLSLLRVTEEDIEVAYRRTSSQVVERIREQIQLSRRFHQIQRSNMKDWESDTGDGIVYGEKWTPIDAVGIYVPGGKNPFPTVQQILGVAATVAGCKRIVSCISPRGDGFEVLIAAKECGLTEIYRVGGAQAIAAMAFGTQTIPAVNLIAGPGSPYVTAAKILCQSKVAIDMPAGPSEAIILADGSTAAGMDLAEKSRFCAADILARAEHGPDSAGVLVTDSEELARLTRQELSRQIKDLSRRQYIEAALSSYSAIIVADTMDDAVAFTNEYAPEHLEILTADPVATFSKINNAGSVFLGAYNPVASGDYATGTNHVLPSCGWARQTSPAGVWTFMKRVQYSVLSKDGLARLSPIVETLAKVEGLDAHRRSVEIRFEKQPAYV